MCYLSDIIVCLVELLCDVGNSNLWINLTDK